MNDFITKKIETYISIYKKENRHFTLLKEFYSSQAIT
jgi:hypothetical protein